MARKRPGALTTAAVLCIVYGALHGIGGVFSFVVLAVGVDLFGPDAARQQAFFERDIAGFHAISWSNNVSALLESILILIAGVGLLNFKAWARPLALIGCIWAIARTLGYVVVTFVLIVPALSRFAEQEMGRLGGGPEAQAAKVLMSVVGVCGGLFLVAWAIYLIIVLVLVGKPNVKRALAEGARETDDDRDRGRDDGPDRPRRPDNDYDDGWDVRRPADDQKDEWRIK